MQQGDLDRCQLNFHDKHKKIQWTFEEQFLKAVVAIVCVCVCVMPSLGV